MDPAETKLTTALLIRSAATLLEHAGQAANQVAEQYVFVDYHKHAKPETLRRQHNDLAQFARYLAHCGVIPDTAAAINTYGQCLFATPAAWQGVTWGLIAAFIRWMLAEGYAIGTINVRLATIKRYAELAFKSGVLSATEKQLIQTVRGLKGVQAENEDLARPTTRVGSKKATATSIGAGQAALLKLQHADTPVGARDALMMALLLDHGLRCSELILLTLASFDRSQKTFKFYRPKVRKWQTQRLTNSTLAAFERYLPHAAAHGCLLRRTERATSDRLADRSMNTREVNRRVGQLGSHIGLTDLSPHDCRHFWVTDLLRNDTPIEDVREMGGWATIQMLLRYLQEHEITNRRARLTTATILPD